jgi:hypothetical protein
MTNAKLQAARSERPMTTATPAVEVTVVLLEEEAKKKTTKKAKKAVAKNTT